MIIETASALADRYPDGAGDRLCLLYQIAELAQADTQLTRRFVR